MKKLIMILSVVFSLSILSACGHSESDYKALNEKIEKDETLTVDDYDMMLDYLDDVLSAVSKVKNQKDLQELSEKYPYANTFMRELQYPSEEAATQIAERAKQFAEKYQQMQQDMSKKLSGYDDEEDDD